MTEILDGSHKFCLDKLLNYVVPISLRELRASNIYYYYFAYESNKIKMVMKVG